MKHILLTVAVGILTMTTAQGQPTSAKYLVKRTASPVKIDANWEKPIWQATEALTLTHHMGETPAHFPKTQAKLRYDSAAVYVIFRVEDRYVRAVANDYQDPVYRDSCVEFFFTPDSNIASGYFNLEMNCGGTALFAHQKKQGEGVVAIDRQDFEQIQVAHSLPKIVDPEISEPTIWTVEYRLPVAILEKYAPVIAPAPGVRWQANFYKCADATSHPHWLTWAKVDYPKPRFHLPEFFGEIVFE